MGQYGEDRQCFKRYTSFKAAEPISFIEPMMQLRTGSFQPADRVRQLIADLQEATQCFVKNDRVFVEFHCEPGHRAAEWYAKERAPLWAAREAGINEM